jgi:hypothetical protein
MVSKDVDVGGSGAKAHVVLEYSLAHPITRLQRRRL